MYLLSEIAVGFATGFGGSLVQEGLKISWEKALEDGINGAISSAIPSSPKRGNCTRLSDCLVFIPLLLVLMISFYFKINILYINYGASVHFLHSLLS